MEEFRLIVTGSREWSDHLGLRGALGGILGMLPAGFTLVVVNGGHENPDYSTNADRIAQEWAAEMKGEGLPVTQEPWPADWEGPCRSDGPSGMPGCEPGHRRVVRGVSLCPAAGPYRNRAMCDAGGDWGLAALKVGTKSTGTKGCIIEMIRHGIRFELVIEGNARGLPRELIAASDRAIERAGLPAGLRGPGVRGDA